MKATKTNALKMSAAVEPHVARLLVATAKAQVLREEIDAIQRRVLADMGLEKFTPETSYQMCDSDAKRYYARIDALQRAAGHNPPPECCVALVAEHEQTKAEWALIEAAQAFFPTLTNEKLLCGTKDMLGLETRQKYIDLLCGMVVAKMRDKR